jgi:hypothetical protein
MPPLVAFAGFSDPAGGFRGPESVGFGFGRHHSCHSTDLAVDVASSAMVGGIRQK